ncbi:MAG: hypothetical protein KDD69_06315, partial [Bdellovibrionales bacterium]|nr:hypothetical protein [Bdellovibrionales bacterium]
IVISDDEANTGLMKLPIIPRDRLERIMLLQWGHLARQNTEMPSWVRQVPEAVQEQVLAGGILSTSNLEPRRQTLIDSPSLLDEQRVQALPGRFRIELGDLAHEGAASEWYIVICDTTGDHALLVDGDFVAHSEWIAPLIAAHAMIDAFMVPRHADQFTVDQFTADQRPVDQTGPGAGETKHLYEQANSPEKVDERGGSGASKAERKALNEKLDQALEDSFPASDPISVGR